MSVVCIARRKGWLYLLAREHPETEFFPARSPRYNGTSEDGGDHEEHNDEEDKAHLCVDLLLVVAGAEGRKDQVSVVHHLCKIFVNIPIQNEFSSLAQNNCT